MTLVKRYKIKFIATDTEPTTLFTDNGSHDLDVVLEKTIRAVDRKSAERIAKGMVYEWMFEEDDEISNRISHPNCIMTWEIKCIRQK